MLWSMLWLRHVFSCLFLCSFVPPSSFDCLFQKLPFLEVKAEPTVLKPNEAVDVPIIFTPRDVQQYSEQIPFELNGLYTVNVTVKGEGCLLKVDLQNPAQALVSFGSLRVGQESARRVRLVNRSKRSAVLSLSDVVEAGTGRLEDRQVTVFPKGPLDIPARGHTDIEIQVRRWTLEGVDIGGGGHWRWWLVGDSMF